MQVTDAAPIPCCCGCGCGVAAAAAPIGPLVWELPYAADVALKGKVRPQFKLPLLHSPG